MTIKPNELIYFVAIRAAWGMVLSRGGRSLEPSIVGLRDLVADGTAESRETR